MFPKDTYLHVNKVSVESLKNILSQTTLASLSYISGVEVKVLSSGKIEPLYRGQKLLFYIQVLPNEIRHSSFNNGMGIVIYFDEEQQLLSCFENLTALREIIPKTFLGFNNTPRTLIPAHHLVKLTYYSRILQAHIIELAILGDSGILGITETDIPPGMTGNVVEVC